MHVTRNSWCMDQESNMYCRNVLEHIQTGECSGYQFTSHAYLPACVCGCDLRSLVILTMYSDRWTLITHEVRGGSSSTMRGHFGCIIKATGHCGIHNGSLVGVLYAYNGHLTMALVWPRWRGKNPGHDAHGNGHGHVRVYGGFGFMITREISQAGKRTFC